MTHSRLFARVLGRTKLARWARSHRVLSAVCLVACCLGLIAGSVGLGVWRALPAGADYRRALAEAPLSPKVVDREGLVVNLPLGADAPTYTPVVSLSELPQDFLKELRAFEGMPRSGVHLGGLRRFVLGREGSAPIQAQVHRRLWELQFDEVYGGGVWGKVTQFVSAIKMSTYVPQDELLAFYVNHVQVTPGPPGFEAAARSLFSKPASDLAAPEWRLLMACVSYPGSCKSEGPSQGRVRAFRAKTQLAAARGWIASDSLDAHLEVPVFVANGRVFYPTAGPILGRAAVETDQILADGDWDYERDGLTIELTADLALTDSLTVLLERAVDRTPGAKYASVLVLDPTGGIVVYAVGTRAGERGRVRQRGMFDALAADRGHPASVIKVLVYAALAEHYLERGVPADSIAHIVLPNRWVRPDGRAVNPGCGGANELSLAAAVKCSANGVAAHAVNEVLGVEAFAAFLAGLGIAAEPHWSLSLGVVDVPAVDLAAALASVLGQDGRRVWPHLRGVGPPAGRVVRVRRLGVGVADEAGGGPAGGPGGPADARGDGRAGRDRTTAGPGLSWGERDGAPVQDGDEQRVALPVADGGGDRAPTGEREASHGAGPRGRGDGGDVGTGRRPGARRGAVSHTECGRCQGESSRRDEATEIGAACVYGCVPPCPMRSDILVEPVHYDPPEHRRPLPLVEQAGAASAVPEGALDFGHQATIRTRADRSMKVVLRTDSPHLSCFFEAQWGGGAPDGVPDATMYAFARLPEAYGLDPELGGRRTWFRDRHEVWQFGTEYYGNIKVSTRGLCSALAADDEVFVHGCSLQIGDRGVILSGRSGTGKTTLTAAMRSASPVVRVINDDWGAVGLSGGETYYTGEARLHMKYRSAFAIDPDLGIGPLTHLSENYADDPEDIHSRLLISRASVFGEDRVSDAGPVSAYCVLTRDETRPAGIRPLEPYDVDWMEGGSTRRRFSAWSDFRMARCS